MTEKESTFLDHSMKGVLIFIGLIAFYSISLGHEITGTLSTEEQVEAEKNVKLIKSLKNIPNFLKNT